MSEKESIRKDKGVKQRSEEALLRPLKYTSPVFYVWVSMLIAIIVFSLFAWGTQLTRGLGVTDMRVVGGGAAWGLYIVNFIWFIGVAHGGIAISAAIRILKVAEYRSIARMAEVLTIACLFMAGLSIVMDLGRPDRAFNLVKYYWERMGMSPLIWDVTVVYIYVALSVVYLGLSMREDIVLLKEDVKGRLKTYLYKLITIGYNKNERAKIEQILWWMALMLLALITLLSGGVVPWIFQFMSSRPGWYGAIQGPYFLTAALASAISAVIFLSAVLKSIFRWSKFINSEIFQSLGKFLALLTAIYLWFMLHEQLTVRFAGPVAELKISDSLLRGDFSLIYWPMLIIGLIIPFLYLFLQGIYPKIFSIRRVTICAIMIMIALWIKRFIIVVPSLLYPLMPFLPETYVPTWIEWSIIAGTFALAALIYTVFIKIFPIMEVN